MITLVGVIGRQDKPLYLKTYENERYSDARLIELAFAACDIFHERIETKARLNDSYFGRLIALEGILLFGSMSNTQIRFVIALQEKTVVINEGKVRHVLSRIQAEYTRAVMNPFHLARVDENGPIVSSNMDRAISQIVASWSHS
ncbi:protein of unknown function [Taphrina deformans PYCC 5710]|uniref:Sedlin n=1 Tax=Taphrina deformans (strain PYCC 5710 / ATCC 11124 / CBS 356.35 / IMI 108563 / JCM 9778 / NBRC 8474) TaxID=1097556 RepID=R4XME5_TAPDE|nr:protein of unknown function [Taphrina deformans PYCC 5710]|eukprot:CCG84475.1 protein of unknown function [Taphrina deformans PYCC 5710]